MSRNIYYHLRTTNAIKREELNFKRPYDYGFSDTEFINMNHKTRSQIIYKMKFLGFYTEADRLKDLARIKQK